MKQRQDGEWTTGYNPFDDCEPPILLPPEPGRVRALLHRLGRWLARL